MKREILVSGVGGQGVMSIGKNLVEAGIEEGHDGSYLPAYGPEMRGGWANCSVIFSDGPIYSPVVDEPDDLIAMTSTAMEQYESAVVPGGIILVNSSIISEKVTRTDVSAYYVPCDEIAIRLGNAKVSNMVMLGAYVAATKVLKAETLETMIEAMFRGPKEKFIPLNKQALHEGMACIEKGKG